MPITKKEDAKEGGFGQVREALKKFKGKVTEYDWGKWGGQLVDEQTGKAIPPKEFFEVTSVDNEVLESTEMLAMDISERFTFRTNCSDFKNSFWVEKFLDAADKFKVLIPDGLVDKIVTWEKVTLVATDPKYNKTDFIIVGIEEAGKPKAKKSEESTAGASSGFDPMVVVQSLAIGKTEVELEEAIKTDLTLSGTPVHPMAKAGIITKALVGGGKLALVDGKYQIPA